MNNTSKIIKDNFIKIVPDQNLYDIGRILTIGDFKKTSFNVGLEPDANHSDPSQHHVLHVLSVQSDSMHIDQNEGYTFLRMEIESGGDTTSYNISGDMNFTSLEIDYALSAVKAFDIELEVDVDILNLTKTINFIDDPLNTVYTKIVNNLPSIFKEH